jgi:hypothetical protein
LANSNYLSARRINPFKPEFQNIKLTQSPASYKFSRVISVYPNPVTNDNVTIQFNKVPDGDYVIELIDVFGRTVMQRTVAVNNEDQVQNLAISRSYARGTYLVKVFDRTARAVFTQKVLVQ